MATLDHKIWVGKKKLELYKGQLWLVDVEGSLFGLFVTLRSPKPCNVFCRVLGTVRKPSMSRCAPSWFHNISTYSGEVIEY